MKGSVHALLSAYVLTHGDDMRRPPIRLLAPKDMRELLDDDGREMSSSQRRQK
jgi:hypothetical protein